MELLDLMRTPAAFAPLVVLLSIEARQGQIPKESIYDVRRYAISGEYSSRNRPNLM